MLYFRLGRRGEGQLIFASFSLLVMAGSGVKCSFVSREAISKELVWSLPPMLVMTKRTGRREEKEYCFCYLIRHNKASYLAIK